MITLTIKKKHSEELLLAPHQLGFSAQEWHVKNKKDKEILLRRYAEDKLSEFELLKWEE